MENPFFAGAARDDDVKVHLWHGVEDLYVPVELSRYISKRLPWVIYHELPGRVPFPGMIVLPSRSVLG
ncbi:hypothetical protein ACP70R_011768 [Stipagrostis hirtigluma subsp. patula]